MSESTEITRTSSKTSAVLRKTGRRTISTLKLAAVGIDNAVVSVEAVVMTAAEPVVQVAKVTGNTYITKWKTARTDHDEFTAWVAERRANRLARKVAKLEQLQAASESQPQPAPEPPVAEQPKRAPRARKATASA